MCARTRGNARATATDHFGDEGNRNERQEYADHSGTRAKGKADFKRLREMRDEDIDYSDIPKLDVTFWKTAKLTMPAPKDRVTIRLDHDLVEWFKKIGSGYQTRIHAISRSYMNAQSGASR